MFTLNNPLRASSIFCVAAMATVAIFTTSTANAQSSQIAYKAELAAPAKASQKIIGDSVVRCTGTECSGTKSTSAAKTVCSKIARQFGPVTAFSYKDQPFDEAAIAKCNG